MKSARQSYVNGLLIATRGQIFPQTCTKSKTQHPFGGGDLRLPGTWEGCCANCKWKEQAKQCSVRRAGEARWTPTNITTALPPPSALEELVDSDEDDEEEEGDDGDDDRDKKGTKRTGTKPSGGPTPKKRKG